MYKALPHPWQAAERMAEDHREDALETGVLRKILNLLHRARG
jgi:hypothetical protein